MGKGSPAGPAWDLGLAGNILVILILKWDCGSAVGPTIE